MNKKRLNRFFRKFYNATFFGEAEFGSWNYSVRSAWNQAGTLKVTNCIVSLVGKEFAGFIFLKKNYIKVHEGIVGWD